MITEREFLERARLDRATLTIWIEEEWLVPARAARELAFTEMDLARANLIRDLKEKMGVNDEGLGVILHLLDQMHGLRRAFRDALRIARERQTPPAAGGPRDLRHAPGSNEAPPTGPLLVPLAGEGRACPEARMNVAA